MDDFQDVSPYVAREMARLYPERWSYDRDRCELIVLKVQPAIIGSCDLSAALTQAGRVAG